MRSERERERETLPGLTPLFTSLLRTLQVSMGYRFTIIDIGLLSNTPVSLYQSVSKSLFLNPSLHHTHTHTHTHRHTHTHTSLPKVSTHTHTHTSQSASAPMGLVGQT